MLSRIRKEENLFIIINSSLLISCLINGLVRKKLENYIIIHCKKFELTRIDPDRKVIGQICE